MEPGWRNCQTGTVSGPGACGGANAGCSRGWCKAFIKHLIVQNSLYGDIYS